MSKNSIPHLCISTHVFCEQQCSQIRFWHRQKPVLRIMILPIPNPGFRILDPRSKNRNKRVGWRKICCHTFFWNHKFHKIDHYFIFEMLKKKIWANFQRIIQLFTRKFVTMLSKNMGLGSGIQDPGSEIRKNLFRIPDPRVKKAPGFRIRNIAQNLPKPLAKIRRYRYRTVLA